MKKINIFILQTTARFSLLIKYLSFVILFSPTSAWTQNVQTNSVEFLIIGDWGGSASDGQKAVGISMSKEAEKIKARFVVTAGDNFHNDGIASASDPRWKTEFEDVYDFPSLRIPWHPSLGNHDYRGNVDCEIEYSKLSTRWKFPSRYYAQKENIDDSNYLLIVHLDTTPFIKNYQREADIYHVENQDINRQLYWLDSVLTFSGARWTIVVGHHSIYAAASNHGNTQELTDKILPILTKHHVPLYVCGHYHVAQRLIRGATNFVVCGGGSSAGSVDQREDVVFGAGSLGFLSVSVSSENIRLKIINEKSDILYAFQISDN